MKWKYHVTFEHDSLGPKSFKGTVGGSLGAAARRAVVDAKGQVEGKLFFESVVILLEKSDG